jgi:hypothetical protein
MPKGQDPAPWPVQLRQLASQITVATTITLPITWMGAMACPSRGQASTRAKIGSTFMIAELPTTPRRGSTLNMIVKAVP